jgi:hypothetical protein
MAKKQWSATHGWQSSNNMLHMADKAVIISYTRMTKQQ